MTFKNLKKLGKHSIVYGAGNLINAAVGFFLIPLYTHALAPSDYGILELLNRTADVIILIIAVGIRQAFIRFFFDKRDKDWQKTVISTTTIYILLTTLITILCVFPFSDFLSKIIIGDRKYGGLLQILVLWIPCELTFNLYITELQVRMQSVKYTIYYCLRSLILVTSNIYLLLYLRWGVKGALITSLWVNAAFAVPMLINSMSSSGLRFSFSLLRDMLKFALPFLPAGFFFYILINGDRYLLNHFGNPAQVGIYALGYKVGMISSLLIMEPFGRVWAPFLFSNMDKPNSSVLFGKTQTYFMFVLVTGGLLLSINATPLLNIISPAAYKEANDIVPFAILAYIFYGSSMIFESGILISKKSFLKIPIFMLAATINRLMNILLIPVLGLHGAALASLMGFGIISLLSLIISQKIFYIRYQYARLSKILISAFITYTICRLVWSLYQNIFLLELVMILSYGGCLFICKFIEKNEIIIARSLIKRFLMNFSLYKRLF